jgi:transcriptional regulator with XRE-family HTH domain
MKNRFTIPDSMLRTVALAIKTRRHELDISQETLAEKAHMHRTYVSLIERNQCNMTMKMLFELACALEVGPTELLELAVFGEKRLRKGQKPKLSDVRVKQRLAAFAERDI